MMQNNVMVDTYRHYVRRRLSFIHMPVICGQSFEKELDMDEKSIHFNTGEGWKRYYGFSLSC